MSILKRAGGGEFHQQADHTIACQDMHKLLLAALHSACRSSARTANKQANK